MRERRRQPLKYFTILALFPPCLLSSPPLPPLPPSLPPYLDLGRLAFPYQRHFHNVSQFPRGWVGEDGATLEGGRRGGGGSVEDGGRAGVGV